MNEERKEEIVQQPPRRGPMGRMGGPPGAPGEKAKNFKGTMAS